MQRRSALDSSGLPPALLKSTPRDVRVSALGAFMLLTAAVLVVVGMWGSIVLGSRAEIAERHHRLFASERIVAAGDIVRLQKRGGGDDDHRITAHYRYTARGQELMGETSAAPRRTRALCRGIASRQSGISHRNPRRAGSTATRHGRRRRAGRRRLCPWYAASVRSC